MSIFDKYDLEEVNNEVTIPNKRGGLIAVVGNSGSGKTTILKAWGMEEDTFDLTTPIYKLFDSDEQAEHYLILAGLRSVPTWRNTLVNVSNGERQRAELAIKLSRGVICIDEFTSLVDRDTAKALCISLNKNKASIKDLTLASCHHDILQWLEFDHAYNADTKTWIDRGSLRQDREIRLSIRPCDTKEVWEIFKRHHYLSGKINASANSWCCYIGDKPVAMTSVIAFPSGNWKNGWRGHRTVVLPEFQGMGIGTLLSDTIAEYIVSTGARFFSKTAHPAFGMHRNNSENWKPTSKNGIIRKDYKSKRKTKEGGHKIAHANRCCYSHEYVGKIQGE